MASRACQNCCSGAEVEFIWSLGGYLLVNFLVRGAWCVVRGGLFRIAYCVFGGVTSLQSCIAASGRRTVVVHGAWCVVRGGLFRIAYCVSGEAGGDRQSGRQSGRQSAGEASNAEIHCTALEFSIPSLLQSDFGGVVVAIVIVVVIEGGGGGDGEGEDEDEDGADFDDVKGAFQEPGVDDGGVSGMGDLHGVRGTNFDEVMAGRADELEVEGDLDEVGAGRAVLAWTRQDCGGMEEVLGLMGDEASGFVGTGDGDGAKCDPEHSADAERPEGLDRVLFDGVEGDEGDGGVRFGLRFKVLHVRCHTVSFQEEFAGRCRGRRTDWIMSQARPVLGPMEEFPANTEIM
jgi:hypothetical protein